MKNSKVKSLIFIIIVALTMVAALVTVSAVFAEGFVITENYNLSSLSNYFTLNNAQYHQELSINAGATTASLSVTNNVVNSDWENPYFDLVVYSPDGVEVQIAGYTPTTLSTELGECYIYERIPHSSPAVTGVMNIGLSLSNVLADGIIKAAVLTHSPNNHYVSNTFDLAMLNNEGLHNIANVSSFDSYTEVASGSYVITNDAIAISDFGTVYLDEDNTTTTLNGNISLNSYVTFNFDWIELENKSTLAGFSEFILYYDDLDGYYYNVGGGMRMSLVGGVATLEYLPFKLADEVSFLYFVDNLTTENEITVNFPCYVNMLYSTLTLGADMSITFDLSGAYTFVGIENYAAVDNTNYTLSIYAPRAYYSTGASVGGVEGFVTSALNFTKNSDNVNFDLVENATLKTALLADATSFIEQYFPSQLYNNISLPLRYQNYDVTYRHSITGDAMNEYGRIIRQSANSSVTIETSVYYDKMQEGNPISSAITVVGTSEEAMLTALNNELRNYIESCSTYQDGIYLLERSCDIFEIITKHSVGMGITTDYSVNTAVDLRLRLVYEQLSETMEQTGKSVLFEPQNSRLVLTKVDNTTVAVDLSTVQTLYLYVPNVALSESSENVVLSYGYRGGVPTQSASFSVNLAGLTYNEKTAYVERYVETLYITSTNTAFEVLQLANNAFYIGSSVSGDLVIPSGLGCTDFEYSMYKVNTSEFESYLNGNNTLNALRTSTYTQNCTESFVVSDGTISVEGIRKNNDQSLIMMIDVSFDSDVVGEQSYTIVREIIIPANGLGGDDYTEYTRGDTFSAYFDGLTEGKLIDSVAGDNAYKFMSFEDGVKLSMSIVNQEDVLYDGTNAFCSLVYNALGYYYEINIDVDNVPAQNTAVQIYALFYLEGAGGEEDTIISEQYYNFIIPGIYKQGRDVQDASIYARMLEEYDSYNGIYLLVDGANATKQTFDCSFNTLSNVTQGTPLSLVGVHLLANTSEMIFDGVTLSTLAPFNAFTSYALTSLSLQNCSITNAMFTELYQNSANLYYLNTLETIRLSGNAIESLVDQNGKPCLYRTVTQLDISAQRSGSTRTLHSIEGAELLPVLSVLDISSNAIADFEPLILASRLTEVDLSDNVATEFTGKNVGDTNAYYGSSGKINIPHYVALEDRGVTLTGDTQTLYTENERLGALILNAISTFKTQYSGITFPIVTYDLVYGSGSQHSISVTYMIEANATIAYQSAVIAGDSERKLFTSAALSNGDSVKLIVTVVEGGVNTYKQFTFTYKEVTP